MLGNMASPIALVLIVVLLGVDAFATVTARRAPQAPWPPSPWRAQSFRMPSSVQMGPAAITGAAEDPYDEEQGVEPVPLPPWRAITDETKRSLGPPYMMGPAPVPDPAEDPYEEGEEETEPLPLPPWRALDDDKKRFLTSDYLNDLTKPSWRRQIRVQYVPQWPVGAPEANPEVGGLRGLRKIEFFRGLRGDLARKLPVYVSDWRDGFSNIGKSLAAVSFLYFACLAPVIAFGGALAGLTGGAMGIAEVLASCGVCGMLYAAFAGQPMTFVAPTGLTLAFTAALYRYCMSLGIPFLPMYSWVGCWTALLMILASTINASGLIRYCTRFTEDVFNALLAFNFLSEARLRTHPVTLTRARTWSA